MAEGPQVKHPPWPVAMEAPASPSPNQIELRGEDPRYLSKQPSFQSVYFDLDVLASSSDEESVDVGKCKDLSVTVLYKSEEADTLAKSEMAVSDSDCQAVSGLRDDRKVVRLRDGPLGGQTTKPARPDSRHEISAPVVDLVIGKCKPGKVSRTVSASPLTIDMTVVCTPAPDPVQAGVVAHELPPTETVKTSVTGFVTSTPFVAAPALVEGERIPQIKKLPTFDLSDSSGLLPSFGLSSSSSSSSSPTLPWGTAEDSSPSFLPNRVRESQSQSTPSEGSLFNVSPLLPELVKQANRENGKTQREGVLLPTILDEFNDSVLGDPISYARIEQVPGSESPLSLPVYAWPPKPAFMIYPIIRTVLPPPPPRSPKCFQRGPHGTVTPCYGRKGQDDRIRDAGLSV